MVDLFLIEISTQCEKRMSCVNGLLSAFSDQFSMRMYTEHFVLVLIEALRTRLHYILVFETPHRSNELYVNESNLELFYCWFYYCQRFRCCRFHTPHMKLDHWLLLFIAQNKNLLQHINFVNSTFNSRMATRNFCEIIFFLYLCVLNLSIHWMSPDRHVDFQKVVNKNQRTLFCKRKEAQQKKIFVCIERLGRKSM